MDYIEVDRSEYDWVTTEGGCAVDNSEGSLVWVRRRNGHWWPGRVLAAHEVPRSHLLVPKSGTPVKLLGKDDASVDWYNFGKSRRIKAFRCGEFDDCIERARSFGCLRSKNREKYARRDDAILHALELEKRQAEGMQGSDRSLSAAAILGPPVSAKQVMLQNDLKGSNHGNSHIASIESRRFFSVQAPQVSNSVDDPTRVGPSTNFDVDNGVVQVIPRMRDLQDFGLQGTDSKANKTRPKNVFKAHSVEDGIQIVNEGNILRSNLQGASVTEDGNNKMESCITRITSGVCSAPSVSKTSLSIVQKRKKHPTSSSADESSHKKRDRRRPLTQVLKKSSNKVATLGCETSAFPSSTTDCQIRVFCSDGTEATSSQDAFKQAIDESRPSSEQGDFYLQPTDHHSIYGLKQDRSRPLTHSDTALTSFWSNYWDSGRWPSLVSAHMDFGLLLGSSYADSVYKGTKSASCLPPVAYTGSATSVNTSNIHKSDAIRTETCHSKSTDCTEKDVEERVALQGMSTWQAKKRRNVRKFPRRLGLKHIEGGNFCRKDGVNEDQDPNAPQTLRTSESTYMRPMREKRLNLLVSKDDTPSPRTKSRGKKVASQSICFMNRKSKSSWSCDNQKQGLQWVNVTIEFNEGNERVCDELVSLFSEVMNRAVLGYPVSVQVLGSRTVFSSHWRKTKPNSVRQMITARVPRCPRHKSLNQSLERDPVCKVRSKYSGRKPSRKSGATLQKTRMLSSLASTDFAVGKEYGGMHVSHRAVPPEVSKAPLVTCIPVHLVFQRIREVLYKQPDNALKESCKELAENKES
ncbi:hypothetical protein GOP47_0018361 [Adiantum capillus-veneris]|uniref:PWWP domain-containing protein n=1 Tax=Adiantum capillus-veneris TaxID=13818 RepID=A0A9D4UI43_ADICA|nr:hypothetical protein GOP47_0018361 [Adiantum capillus-veneris]